MQRKGQAHKSNQEYESTEAQLELFQQGKNDVGLQRELSIPFQQKQGTANYYLPYNVFQMQETCMCKM